MTKLILVRHGSTSWTKNKRYQGVSDVPLSREGIKQAKNVAKRLKKENIGLIYTSKLRRAIQTTEQINKFHELPIIKKNELNERSYGKWGGLTKEQVREKYPRGYERYHKNKYGVRPTGGESLLDLRKGLKKFIETVINKNKEKTILISTHNGPLRVMLGILMNWSGRNIASLQMKPTSITLIEIKNGKKKMILMNCDEHNK